MSLLNWQSAIHDYKPASATDARCTSGWYNDAGDYIKCTSDQRASVLHRTYEGCYRGCCASEADHNERHNHGGGDCMCFELED